MNVITLAHGAGGKETERIIKSLFINYRIRKVNSGIGLDAFDDGSTIPFGGKHVVVSSDSYTVDPIFFPGGNIGKLAAVGSINDVAVMGAIPIAALDNIVVEEGFPYNQLRKIVNSMLEVFEKENVALLGGDFKVMPRGKIDKIVISTTVIGIADSIITDSGAKPGDYVIVSGTVGDHGAVITAIQSGIEAEIGDLKSDCAPVTRIMQIAKKIGGIHAAKDITRGGLAMALNEIAEKSRVSMIIEEEMIPLKEEVIGLSELLGIDPLILASEGKVVLIVDRERAEEVVKSLRREGFNEASIIGEVKEGKPGFVILRSSFGGLRLLDKPIGEITPRIC